MSELYSEFLVKKESTFKDALIKFGMIGLTVVAVAAGLFLNPLLLIVAIGLGVACYFIIPKLLNIADFIPQLSNMALLKKLLTQMQSEFIMIFVWNVIMLFQIS